jgi:trehalose 6-phosphate synthase
MTSTADVVLAGDRGPTTYAVRDGRLVPQPRHSGVVRALVTARRSVAGTVAYVSTTTSPADQEALRRGCFAAPPGDRTAIDLSPVYVDPDEYRAYYDEIGVRMLWLAHHDLWRPLGVEGIADASAFEAYERVNALVAERAVRHARADSLIMLHDYQLATAAAVVREHRPAAVIAHFVHTAFATPASLTRLPARVVTQVLRGMLAADLVCFQSPRWARNFLACCELVGGDVDAERGRVRHGGRQSWIRSYPTPVDPAGVVRSGSTARARSWATRTATVELSLIRVDRLDPAKGVLPGFEAFELLLERRPALRGRVTFTAFLVPSRERVSEYREYAQRVWDAVERINTHYPGSVRVHHGEDRERALGGLRGYDVLLVNPVCDGMNVVAQEGPLLNLRDGVLVLSNGAGAAGILGEGALLIQDPTDIGETADRLAQALALDRDERRRRAERLRAVVRSNHPGDWLTRQLTDLRRVRDGKPPISDQNGEASR